MKKKYLESHEWIKENSDGIFEIGMSGYAQKSLGDIVFVELPEVGTHLEEEKEFCTVESVKAASDLYSPLDGDVIEVNTELVDSPEIINQSQGEIWIIKVKGEIKSPEKLMSEDEYNEFVSKLDE